MPDLRRCERMPWARPTVERTAFYGDSPNYAKKRLKEYEDWKEKVGRDFTPDELVSDITSRMPEPEEEGQAQ